MSASRRRDHPPGASHETLALLDAKRGALEPPIRSQIFGLARFQQHGQSLGAAHTATRQTADSASFFPRLHENIKVLGEAHRYLGTQQRFEQAVSPAGEWLLDNFHIVQAQLTEVRSALPHRYFRHLPVLLDEHLAGLPRVYGIAWAFVAHTDSVIDEELLSGFLEAYQRTRELNLGELWALPTCLRVVLIENLRRLAERVAACKAARELAHLSCEQLDVQDRAGWQERFERMRQRGVLDVFALQLLQRLHPDLGLASADRYQAALREAGTEAPLALALAQALPDPAAAHSRQQAEEVADNLSVGNAINALRLLADIDWRTLIARCSLLMSTMSRSPIFMAERDDTQDSTLHAIEALARRSGSSELRVAQALLALMELPNREEAAWVVAPSYWLRGPGASRLRHKLGLPQPWLPQAARMLSVLRLPLYLAMLGLGSLGLSLALIDKLAAPGISGAWLGLLLLCTLFPVSEALQAVLTRLVSESLPPHKLPRLALPSGIPPEHRVLVVLPVLIHREAGLPALLAQLQRHYLSNREPQAQFALLSDFADAPSQHRAEDGPLLAAARRGIEQLEAQHRRAEDPAGSRRFLLLHRERRWSESEQCWMGWERKRGKLEQLLCWMAQGGASPFLALGACSQPRDGTPYVLTLDSDTGLPPGALRELVAVAAHPLNQPQLDPLQRRVIAGYGILQPRLLSQRPLAPGASLYQRLFAAHGGMDPYGAPSSEVYQDLFEAGSFTGKGLLNVQAMHKVLGGRWPEGQILSHDLIEGALARCAGVSELSLLEDPPGHPDVQASRLHRWTRGDWQLLPLLLRPGAHELDLLNRWKLLDNLRRSLVAPFSLGLILLSLVPGLLPVGAALWLVTAAYGAGPLLGAVASLAPSRDDIALWRFYRQGLLDLLRVAAATLWQLAQLAGQANLQIDAVLRALYRMSISHRRLLQWTTAEAAQAAAAQHLAGLLRQHGRDSLALLLLGALLLLAEGLGLAPWQPVWTLGLFALWASRPLCIWLSTRPLARAVGPPALAPQDRAYLQGVARDTWTLFERHVGPQSPHLPPDNVQTVPELLVAHRTSPTNMGLYLLSLACAQRFGWISLEAMLDRAELTLASMARLERHQGHFLNWYDTRNGLALAPRYVSTVDSGNLCGHLLALAGACEALQDQALESHGRLRLLALAAECRQLAEQAQFGFLYDARRRLLHIGYRLDEQALDASCYDLLASEARLASFWALAKGDVPLVHWKALGRPFFGNGAQLGLLSWSGSMFEYLMPSLILDEPPGTVLASAAHAALVAQMAHGQALDLPWGVSESAYATMDQSLAYQYAPQGIAALALRRTPPDEQVVAPYASALAALLMPGAAVANLRRMEALQARGELGFVEALDYTAERQPAGASLTLVRTHMAHHQGMCIVALANVLLQEAPRRWAMADPRLDAMAPLLHERLPQEVPRRHTPPPALARKDRRQTTAGPARRLLPGTTGLQPTQLLSNGRYSLALRPNGAGWSRWRGLDITRWRDDALRDAYGSFLYLRRSPEQALVSLSQHPAPDPAAHYQAEFHDDRVVLEAQWPDLRSRCTVWISPEDDLELRRLELWNEGETPLMLELISMFEPSLCASRADAEHPAFSNLFVSADWCAADRALYLQRRPRLSGEPALHAVHFLAQADGHLRQVRVQTDRAQWTGRGRDASQPLANFEPASPESGPRPTGLDPVAALSLHLQLPPRALLSLTLATAAAADRAALETLVDRYAQAPVVERSSMMAATVARLRWREMRMPAQEVAALQQITSMLVHLLSRPPPRRQPVLGPALDERLFDRRELWRFGISGELPLLLVQINSLQGLRLLRSLLQGHRQWAWAGLACELVILSGEPRSYLMPLQQELNFLLERQAREAEEGPAPGSCRLHLLHADELSEAGRVALMALARLRLVADGRALSQQMAEIGAWHEQALARRDEQLGSGLTPAIRALTAGPEAGPDATSRPQFGGEFEAGGAVYRFAVQGEQRPRKPWINVLANARFGCLLTDSGAGYSWAVNSRLQQITPWSNDPLSDPGSEGIYLQDLHSHEVWSAGAAEVAGGPRYTVSHTQGRSSISHQRGAIAVAASWCVDAELPLKQLRLTLHNQGTRRRALRVLASIEWMMGAQRADRAGVRCAHETLRQPGWRCELLLALQADAHAGFGGSTAFALLHEPARPDTLLTDWSCDRRELFDARGQRCFPDILGSQAGAGLDPCAALSRQLDLLPGGRAELVLLLGHGETPDAARELARQAVDGLMRQAPSALAREELALAAWDARLAPVQVKTPDPLFDALVNRWLPYQTLACRLWARSAFYQAGGAYGFRDQLQDAMALALSAPELLREQVLRAAAQQFPEGDVLHWWHPPGGAGVRSRISDDRLWLPYAVTRYLQLSGDVGLLDEGLPFLEGEPLAAEQEDRYFEPRPGAQSASVYEHCARSLDHSQQVGAHGLPLMGSGDWNDGMNRVGHLGRGESVWLAFFLCHVVQGFAPTARARGDIERAQRWELAAARWRRALEHSAWDGQWFVRAFFDDGSALGTRQRAECRIDLIAQAWSVISGAASPTRQRSAMDAVARALIDESQGLIRLLDPPLQHAQPEAGYIQAYPPGVRENGGQYSHAGVWALMAQAALGDANAAYRSFTRLSPAHRSADPSQGRAYLAEPYVMAGDVYTQPPYAGQAGWSWYTGSAAWMYRAALESLCGLQLRANRLCLEPCLPSHWQGISLRLQREGRRHEFILCTALNRAELARALARRAIPLSRGEWIDLRTCGDDSCHLLMLDARPAPSRR
ncbi:GH36-type glycosyl hydrolase domain-containing protein [Roseateles sp.]|uniref:GH36-type glycosyl hydrolase domain-containing protein n=1 Tax=Roseateles sp. TaxID=1971397 RepID=UPI00391DE273